MASGLPESGFSRAVSEFLPLVNCRKPSNIGELESIYRLRYAAYLKEGALPPGAPELFKDQYDGAENSCTLGCYVGGSLASSIRLHVATKAEPRIPAMGVFADILQPLLDKGVKVLDPTRFVVDATAARLFPRLPYATVRLCALAGAYYGVDLILATVRAEHQAFYKRIFGHRILCEPRVYPTLSKPISLMAVDYREIRDNVTERYPFFRTSAEELKAIFDGEGCYCGVAEEACLPSASTS